MKRIVAATLLAAFILAGGAVHAQTSDGSRDKSATQTPKAANSTKATKTKTTKSTKSTKSTKAAKTTKSTKMAKAPKKPTNSASANN